MNDLTPLKEVVKTCMQCGTCTASCPNATAMDMTPRKLWRLVLTDRTDEIFSSATFFLCSTCYTCTLRCPRGLELTTAMSMLKEMATKADMPRYRVSSRFYSSFMESVRRHGRVRESEFMTLYFMAMKHPLLPVKFTSLGLKLLSKNKVKFQVPSKSDKDTMVRLFEKVSQIEERK